MTVSGSEPQPTGGRPDGRAVVGVIAMTLALIGSGCGLAERPGTAGAETERPPGQPVAESTTVTERLQGERSDGVRIDRAAGTAERVGPAAANAAAARDAQAGADLISPDARGTIVAEATADRIVARERPSAAAAEVASFVNPTDRGGPLILQALGPPVDGWLEVLLPIRPNGTVGWVDADQVDLTINPYRIEVDASSYSLTVYRYGDLVLETTIAVGNGETPTPLGRFYLIELLRPSDPTGVYGPYAYGLSGYSDTLSSFNGGEGVIGIHGTNQPELLGNDVSHGCVRVANDVITEMTTFLPLGTPVEIYKADPTA